MKANNFENLVELGSCGLEHTLPRLNEILDKLVEVYKGFDNEISVFKEAIREGNLKLAWSYLLGECKWLEEYGILTVLECHTNTNVGIRFDGDGSLFEVLRYENGLLNGLAESYRRDGSLRERIEYKYGVKHGIYEWHFTSGILNEKANYYEGEYHGLFEEFYLDGSIKVRGNYTYGKKDGVFEVFNNDGSILSSKTYIDGYEDWEYPYNEDDF
jgi:antitoxin component YwqK of YwqJK toxin-antitoxin module